MEGKLSVPGTKAPDKRRLRKPSKQANSGLYVEIDLSDAGFDPASLFRKDAEAIGSYVYHPEIVAPHRHQDPYRVMRRNKRQQSIGATVTDAAKTALSVPFAFGWEVFRAVKPRQGRVALGMPAWLAPAGATAAVAGLGAWLLLGVAPRPEPVLQQILAQNAAEKTQAAVRLASDQGLINATRSRIVEYTSKAGDTFNTLAQRFHLSESTLRQANGLGRMSLKPGQVLAILPVNGVLHEVGKGETSLELAYRYGLPLAKIKEANKEIELDRLRVGQKIVIPGAAAVKLRPEPVVVRPRLRETGSYRIATANYRVAAAAERPSRQTSRERTAPVSRSLSAGGGRFVYPAAGQLSSRFGWRWGGFHSGVDIANQPGTTIRAARDGIVVSAAWDGAYGQAIVVSHGGGVTTRYGHCSRMLVSPGQRVEAGQPIGAVGSTGRSTGPHVHFEVMINGAHVNPMNYL